MKWLSRFEDLANLVASWSKDPSTKVGCVIFDDYNRIVGVGYNGFPRGVSDEEGRYEDRAIKYAMVSHAEENALDNCNFNIAGCSIFVNKHPCSGCAKHIIARGIKRVYYVVDEAFEERNETSFKIAKIMFQEAGVELIDSLNDENRL